jgi:hypothetical protein
MTNRARTSIAFAGLIVLAACGSSSTGPADSLSAARARWARNAPTAYSYTIQRSCECLAETAGPVTVVVRNGAVESQQYVATGAAVSAQYAPIFPAVEGLFTIIDNAIKNGTKPLTTQYDPTLGYPTRIALGDPAVDAPLYLVSDLRVR